MSNKMALDALTAIQDAIGMPTSGDSSDFVWPKSTMRHPGETAYGWICEKHGLGYQSGCICCAGDLKAYREQKDREARYAREDAIRDASKKVRAAIAALQAEPQGWMPIESAPKDGTRYLAYDGKYIREENSPAHHAAGDWTLIYGEWRGRAYGLPALLWIPLSALPATPPKD